MFGYPYSYTRPQSYYPSTTGYPYNYERMPQRPRSFYDYDDYDYNPGVVDDYRRRLALAEQKRRIELEMLREEEERRRREAYMGSSGYPYPQPIQPSQETQRVRRVPIRSRSNSPSAPEAKPIPTHTGNLSEQPAAPLPTEPVAGASMSSALGVDEEKFNQAANKIQVAYRRHRTLVAISSHHEQFKKLCEQFEMPKSLDFEYEGKVSLRVAPETPTEGEEVAKVMPTVTAKLGYTPNNAPLHEHIEQLNRLLIALDAIESFGDPAIRRKRKEVVKEIEGEMERVEGLWRASWERFSS